jgi:hypothetical protein
MCASVELNPLIIMGMCPAQHVEHCRAAALVRNMHHLDAGELIEHLTAQMPDLAYAGGGVEDLFGIGARIRDELLERPGRDRRMHDKHVGRRCGQGDRRVVPNRIVRQPGVEAGSDGETGDIGQDYGVAVGRGFRGELHADVAIRAGTVIDHDLLAERLAQVLPETCAPACRCCRRGANGTMKRIGFDGYDCAGLSAQGSTTTVETTAAAIM